MYTTITHIKERSLQAFIFTFIALSVALIFTITLSTFICKSYRRMRHKNFVKRNLHNKVPRKTLIL